MNDRNIPFVNITKRDIIAFQNWAIYENKNSPARVRRLKAVLRSLSNYIQNILDDEYPDYKGVVSKVENPVNTPVREKTVLSDEQIKTILDTLVSDGRYQIACAVALAAYSGRRKAELPRFKVDYFNDENLMCDGSLYKTPEKIKTKGRGTQGKMLHCYTLAKEFKPYFDLWMKDRQEKGIESDWLLCNDDGEQLLTSTLDYWADLISKLGQKTWGMAFVFYWHCMRHRFTTALSKVGVPDKVIQKLQGWSDISLVGVYCDTEAEDDFDQYFTADGIKGAESKSLSDL